MRKIFGEKYQIVGNFNKLKSVGSQEHFPRKKLK